MRPVLTAEQRSDGQLLWLFDAPPSTPFFEGHFPGHPILPGVVALDWLLSAAERLLERPATSMTLLNVKFQTVIEPDAKLELTLVLKSAGHILGTIRSAAGVHATALIPVAEG